MSRAGRRVLAFRSGSLRSGNILFSTNLSGMNSYRRFAIIPTYTSSAIILSEHRILLVRSEYVGHGLQPVIPQRCLRLLDVDCGLSRLRGSKFRGQRRLGEQPLHQFGQSR